MSREGFMRALDERLGEGARAYGDKSYERSEIELLEELQLECLDLAGWGYVLWEKIERSKERLAR